jgi:hypothetical protein
VSLPAPFLPKACCQHGVSSVRRVRLKAERTEHGGVNDQNRKQSAAPPAGPTRGRCHAQRVRPPCVRTQAP